MTEPRSGYRRVLTHPVAGRLAVTTLVSSLGDFIGLGVLLLVMYERSGQRATGPALLFAVQAVPALVIGTVASAWIERLDARRALTWASLGGAASIALVLATSTLWPVLVAAAGLGLSRSVSTPLRNAVTVSDVPDELRTPLITIGQASFQSAQVLGFLLGGTAAVAGLGDAALWFDLASFVVGAALLATLPLTDVVVPDTTEPRRAGEGLRVIMTHPVARSVVPATWAVLLIGALPEAMTPALVEGFWVGPSLVAAAAVTLVLSLWLGRSRYLESPGRIQWFALLAPVTLLATGVIAAMDAPPWAIVASHALMGVAAMYTVGAQAVLARTVSRGDIVHLAATMGASLIVLEGLGALIVAALFDRVTPLAAYAVVAAITSAPILAGMRVRPSPEAVERAAERAAVG